MKYLATLTGIALAFGLSHQAQAFELSHQASAQTQAASTQNAASQAQSSQQQAIRTAQNDQPRVPVISAGSEVKKIGFRLQEWTTIHAHSTDDAKLTIATLQKLGCEVESDNHGNHIDVNYRCLEWKSMKLATDQLVNQWTTWCAAKGMETVVINPLPTTKKPTVRFRLPVERTVHLHDQEQANQILNTLKLIGCEVSSNEHAGHIDATFRCPDWVTIELPSDAKAHGWQKWLDESGFETQHTH